MNGKTALLLASTLLLGCGKNHTGEYLLVSDHVTTFGVDKKTGQRIEPGSPNQFMLAMAGRYKEDYTLAPGRHLLKIRQNGKELQGEMESNMGGRSVSLSIKRGYVGDDSEIHLELAQGDGILKLDGKPHNDPSILLFSNEDFLNVFGGITNEVYGKGVIAFKRLPTADVGSQEKILRTDLAQAEVELLRTYAKDKNNPLTGRLYRALVNAKVQIPDDLKETLSKDGR